MLSLEIKNGSAIRKTENTPGKKEERGSSLSLLPEEIFEMILGFVPIHEYPRLSLTCKSWKKSLENVQKPLEEQVQTFLATHGYKPAPDQEKRMPREIELSSKQLKKIPDFLYLAPNLQTLKLNGNQLTELPLSLALCSQLTHLDLSNNKFTTFPSVLLKMGKLKQVNIKQNPLISKPASAPFKLETDPNIRRINSSKEALPQAQNLTQVSPFRFGSPVRSQRDHREADFSGKNC